MRLTFTVILLGGVLLLSNHGKCQEQHFRIVVKINEYYSVAASPTGSSEEVFSFNHATIQSYEKLQYGNFGTSSRTHQKSKYLEGVFFADVLTSDLSKLLQEIEQYPNVIYAEAIHPEQLLLVPNDPQRNTQDYLAVIRAFEAWDVTTGDPDIVIAVSDNGFDVDHEDFEGKIYENLADPVNGLDDDGNGYIDDTYGYDLADDDNLPAADLNDHGTRVAGVAAAATNNNKGIAGVGYQSSFYPLKVFRSADGLSSGTYTSIVYAADMGFDVINLSWGSIGSYSEFNQDVINYATLEKDVVVVAAAGNTPGEFAFFPASYEHVLSVGASNVDDTKAGFATYSYRIDLMAPGASVFGTIRDDQYGAQQGSSFSAPQVAGAAALVRHAFPDLDAIQVMEQLRVTADDIYEVGSNSNYFGQLGHGRLNVESAVVNDTVPAIRAINFNYVGPFGSEVFFRDTVQVNLDLVNYLRTVEQGNMQVSVVSNNAELTNSTFVMGTLNEYDTLGNVELNVIVAEDAGASERIILRLDFTDANGYEDFQYVEFTTAPSRLQSNNQQIDLTVAANGRLGYQTDVLDNGVGLLFEGSRVSRFMGIMIGNHPDSISDNVINSYDNFTYNTDFQQNAVLRYFDHELANQYLRNTINDSLADNINGLLIEQEFMNWSDNENYLISEYYISNISAEDRNAMRFGLYHDFNCADSISNFAAWDETNKLAYTYSNDEDAPYVGVALLTGQNVFVNAIDLFDSNGDPIDITTDFTDQLKYDLLTTEKLAAGGTDGHDVAQLLSVALDNFAAGASEKIAIAWVFGTSLEELQDLVQLAVTNYAAFVDIPSVEKTVAQCENVDVEFVSEKTMNIFSDVAGTNQVATGSAFNLGIYQKDTAFYFQYQGVAVSDMYRIDLSIFDPQADFFADPDTLFLGDTPTNTIQFTDTSGDAVSWTWDFDNGSSTIVQHPTVVYNTQGVYIVTLDIVASNGCLDQKVKDVLVAQRSPDPIIDDQTICFGTNTSITASNSTDLKFYVTADDVQPLVEGTELVTGAITSDTTFYVSSVADLHESHRIAVNISIDDLSAGFDIHPDTLDLSGSQLLSMTDQSINQISLEWFVDGNTQGGSTGIVFDYTGLSNLQIKQVVESSIGCKDSLTMNLEITESTIPTGADFDICRWDSLQLNPGGGEFFVFYADQALSQIIDKGKNPFFGLIERDTSFYVTNVSNYGESQAIQLDVQVDPFDPIISADPDSLQLKTGRNVTFSADNNSIIAYQWFVDDEFKETAAEPTLLFNDLGTFRISLISESNKHCIDTSYLDYLVYEITSIENQLSELIQLFPNPVTDELVLKLLHVELPKNITFHNAVGQEVKVSAIREMDTIKYPTSHLTSGIYFMKGEILGTPFQFKIIKK